ncbi:DEAD/DEAH box helicase [Sphingobium aromaticivastans]|uniref:DEAD/DEAH box helicase n=1 Tax=Sphingobium aromaticivastans TaxID=1778665 RepID=UPI003017071B
MIPAITDHLLTNSIQNERMIRAGLDYFLEDRVGDLAFDPQFNSVSAIVEGSGRNSYVTTIIFDPELPKNLAESDCTCPVGYGCKHAAALLHALRRFGSPEGSGLRITAASAAPSMVSGPLGEWLEGVSIDNLAARIVPDQLCFVIEPARAFRQAKGPKGAKTATGTEPSRFILQVRARQRRAQGGDWQIIQPYVLQHRSTHFEPGGLRLLARMNAKELGGDFAAKGTPIGQHGWQWLFEAAKAGLLRWKRPDGPAVTVTQDPLKARLAWRLLEDGRQMLVLEDIDETLKIFAGDPPLFFDEDRYMLGLVDTGIAPLIAGRLLAMPPIEPAQLPALAARWEEIAGGALHLPQIMMPQRFKPITPRPVLHFLTDKIPYVDSFLSWGRTQARPTPVELARLEFDYEGHRVRANMPAREVVVRTEEGLICFPRDLEAEQAAADRLAETLLLPISLLEDFQPKDHQAWDHVLMSRELEDTAADNYPDFLINEKTALEAEGWLIEYAPDWYHAFVPLDSEDTSLALAPQAAPSAASGEPIDWFDVELAALVDGQRVNILPALRRLIAEDGGDLLARDDDHRLPLMLGNGRFTAIRLGLVRPLLETLLRLAVADRSAGPLRLNRYDLGTIYEIAGSGLAWTGEANLRQLAGALHQPDRAGYIAPDGLQAQLRPYQETGVAWLQALHDAGFGGILADDMGLGKTLQAITHILHVRQTADAGAFHPILIVAPTSVLPNWQAELARFAPGLECLLWHGADRQGRSDELGRSAILLTSYALLARDKDLLGKQDYALIVLDEAHVLKNPKTAGFKAAATLKARQVVALSGTPIENRLNDLWALASLANPGLLGSFEAFRNGYRTPIEKQGDPAAKAALGRRLRPFMLRRTKDEVAADLPAKTIIPERIELSEAQMRLYESQRLLMQARVRDEIDRVGLMRSQIIVLDAMLKLRQICCDPSLLPRGLGEGVASAKRARLLEMLPELVEEGRRVILFSQFTAMLDRIAADLDAIGIPYEQLRGSTRDRARPVRRFQQGEVPLILVSLKAGGAGVNLTAADTVILYDPWWNPAVEAQAIDRAHRIGQTKAVFVHRMIATGSIEEKILVLQERKQGLADMLWSEQANTGGPGLDDDDIAFLLG